MSKYIFLLVFYIMLLSSSNTLADNFISGFEDIPLMTGLTQLDDDISFGNEETRYIETNIRAAKNITFNQIKEYYITSLHHLGWRIKKESLETIIFVRENDILEIGIIKNTPLKIGISLKNSI